MQITIPSRKHTQLIDITRSIQEAVSSRGMTAGLVHIFSLHTTAGITINENADPDVVKDIINTLAAVFPWENNYRHREGNAAAHLKTSFMGASQQVPVENGKLVLGTWQSIFMCEFDGPRTRKIQLTFLQAGPAPQ